jgi:hypothetical protein
VERPRELGLQELLRGAAQGFLARPAVQLFRAAVPVPNAAAVKRPDKDRIVGQVEKLSLLACGFSVQRWSPPWVV